MRLFLSESNGETIPIPLEEFPSTFAVCSSLYPKPQFQIVSHSGHRWYGTETCNLVNNYRKMRRICDIEEYYFVDESSQDRRRRYKFGTFHALDQTGNWNQRDSSLIEVQFEIHKIYLVNQNTRIPIVILHPEDRELSKILPHTSIVITPINFAETPHYDSATNSQTIRNFLLCGRNNDYLIPMNDARSRRRPWFDVSTHPFYPSSGMLSDDEDEDNYIQLRSNTIAVGAGQGRRNRRDSIEDIQQSAQLLMAIGRSSRRTPGIIPEPVTTTTSSSSSSNNPPTSTVHLKSFTVKALIDYAIQEKMSCPISMTPITKDTACVTTCQHVFERANLEQWFADHSTCPVCRQETQICDTSTV